jgi:O-antigen/teichoic acid export membrane protein
MINRLISQYLKSNDERGKRIVKQIAAGAGLKVINAGISIIIIPLYLSLLTDVSFGIWLTVSAAINWFNLFDLGLGNGLRNRFAEARAAGDDLKARIYVSTAYFVIGAVALVLLGAFFIADVFVNWGLAFAAPPYLHADVNVMTRILVSLFLPQFVLQLVKMVVTADQRPAWANAINSVVNVLQLGAVLLLVMSHKDGLPQLALAMGTINMVVPLFANFLLFGKRYRRYRPSIKWVRMEYARDLLSLGAVFFILQGAALVVFMTDNVIISQVLGPEEVPAYNISYRYFNFAAVFFGLVTTPFWSAFTDAFVKRDMAWISRMMKRLIALWAALSGLTLLMLLSAPWVYHLWIGDAIAIPFTLNFMMALWVIMSTGMGIFGTLLSGVGKLRITLYHAVFVMIINIPLSIWLAGFPALGSAGVILASLLGVCVRVLFQPLQCYKIVQGTARGIWNR